MVIRVDQRPRRARGLELLLGQSANRLHGDVAGVPEGAGVEHALEHAEALPDQLPRLELKVGGGRGALGLHGSMLLVRVHGVAAPIKRVRRSAMRSSESAPDRRSQCIASQRAAYIFQDHRNLVVGHTAPLSSLSRLTTASISLTLLGGGDNRRPGDEGTSRKRQQAGTQGSDR